MKHTLVHANVDGYELVVGFGEAAVDPVATWAAIQEKVLALPVAAQIKAIKMKISAQLELARDQWTAAENAEKAGLTKQAASNLATREAALKQIPLLEEELAPLAAQYEAERGRLFEENAVYSTPGVNESPIAKADFERLSGLGAGLASRQRLTVTGEIVEDWRGTVYWTKPGKFWMKGVVASVGEKIPARAIADAELSEAQRVEISEQLETERLAALDPTARDAEKAQALNVAANEAVQKRNLAEVTGKTFDAKAWYEEKAAAIEKKYEA